MEVSEEIHAPTALLREEKAPVLTKSKSV